MAQEENPTMTAPALEIWIGAYGAKEEVGITLLHLLSDSGELIKIAEYGGIENASFLRLNREGTRLYAVSETAAYDDGEEGGQLASFPVDADTRKLGPGQFHPTHGEHPCHLSLTPSEDWLAVANYSGASVTMYPLGPDTLPGPPAIRFRHTGSGPNTDRQGAPHPHSVWFSPDGQYLFVPDLGMDKIMVYTRGPEAHEWTAHDAVSLDPGAGPRHFAFHPSGKAAYVLNELNNTVTRFTYEEPGKLVRLGSVSTLPVSYSDESTCAEILVSPDGRFIYASNRGHDSIAIFRIDERSGELLASGHVSTRGKSPRNFALTPDGRWLVAANQQSDNIVLFRIDSESGLPVYAGKELFVSKPVCVLVR
jgi:6-phosphogluconolactonase